MVLNCFIEDHPNYKYRIAEEDIYCYIAVEKIREKYVDDNKQTFEIGNSYSNKEKEERHRVMSNGHIDGFYVNKGFYHTLKDKIEARSYAYTFSGEVLECVIPKGTKYYCGLRHYEEYFTRGSKWAWGYASRDIKVL